VRFLKHSFWSHADFKSDAISITELRK